MTPPYTSDDELVEAEPMPEIEPPSAQPDDTTQPGTSGWWKAGSIFWTVTGAMSLIVNFILVIVVIVLLSQLSSIKRMVQNDVLGGLYANFIMMDEASIRTTIPVHAEVPAKFKLPLDTDTTVVLIDDTPIRGARVTLQTGGLSITNAPADIVLPAGTELPIHLSLEVPVDQKIPVDLKVDVNIPLKETELHRPFVGLKNVVAPYYWMLFKLPDSTTQLMCGNSPSSLCQFLFP